jgi:hypothetical protein
MTCHARARVSRLGCKHARCDPGPPHARAPGTARRVRRVVGAWSQVPRGFLPTTSLALAQVWTVAFSKDGTRLASGSDDRHLVIYSMA